MSLDVMWDPAKHDLRARLLRMTTLVEDHILWWGVLRWHLNPLMVLEDFVLVWNTGSQLSHLPNNDLLAVADQLTCRFFKSRVWSRLVNLLGHISLVRHHERGFAVILWSLNLV